MPTYLNSIYIDDARNDITITSQKFPSFNFRIIHETSKITIKNAWNFLFFRNTGSYNQGQADHDQYPGPVTSGIPVMWCWEMVRVTIIIPISRKVIYMNLVDMFVINQNKAFFLVHIVFFVWRLEIQLYSMKRILEKMWFNRK